MQCGRPGFDPWVGKIPWRRERLPTPVFWLGEFHGLCSPWGRKEADTTKQQLHSSSRAFRRKPPVSPLSGFLCFSRSHLAELWTASCCHLPLLLPPPPVSRVSYLVLLGPLLPRLFSSSQSVHGLACLWFSDMSRTWSRSLRSRCPRVLCVHLYTCGWDYHRSPWQPEGLGRDQRPTEHAWSLGMVLTEREVALHGTPEQEWARAGISTSCVWSTV